MKKINTIDLFTGCGGLCEGFEMTGYFSTLACVEWEKAPCENLKKHLLEKWNYSNAEQMVMCFDIQRSEELFEGWNDIKYGTSSGLNSVVGNNDVQLIIGGPPCQAYSIAGRIRDKNGMRDDYRNFLFESYIKVVKKYKPQAFVFENVPGILSATPTGEPIINIIRKAFDEAGYIMISDLSKAIIDFSEYGVPQNRKRIIILGLCKEIYKDKTNDLLEYFYLTLLPKYKVKRKLTVKEAIGDLEPLYPLQEEIKVNRKRLSHSLPKLPKENHYSRWHSKRDQKIFKMLAEDIETGEKKYTSTEALKKLYTQETGKKSNVHKYYVLRWNEQSNLIPAHLYKDGLRHIHPDSKQARSITVREAARLQGFPDDYIFVGTQAEQFKMIGNAVPPTFSKKLAEAIYELLFKG